MTRDWVGELRAQRDAILERTEALTVLAEAGGHAKTVAALVRLRAVVEAASLRDVRTWGQPALDQLAVLAALMPVAGRA